MRKEKRMGLPIVALLVYLFLYIPIVTLVIFSFNSAQYAYAWKGFTFDWYSKLLEEKDLLDAVFNSLLIATLSTILSVALSLLFVSRAPRRLVDISMPAFLAGLAVPEIVFVVGLLSLLVFFMVPLGIATIVAGHTVLGLGYVMPIIKSRYQELSDSYSEVSRDLGASRRQTFFYVLLPQLYPALMAGSLLTFMVSLDDFIIGFFVAGASVQTLPMYIFSIVRVGASPAINAISSIFLLLSSLLVMLLTWISIKKMETL